MKLFVGCENVNIFNSLQMIRIMFNNGQGVQTLVKNISEKKYGIVSDKFKAILKETDIGKPLGEAIDAASMKEKNKYMKYLLNTFRISVDHDTDINQSIDEIEKQLLDDQKSLIDKFILHSNRMLMFSLYTCFLPFLYIILEIINWVLTDFMETPIAFINESFRLYFWIFVTLFIGVFTLFIRYTGGAADE